MSTLTRCDQCGDEIASIDKRATWIVQTTVDKVTATNRGAVIQKRGDACSPDCARKLAGSFVDAMTKNTLGGGD